MLSTGPKTTQIYIIDLHTYRYLNYNLRRPGESKGARGCKWNGLQKQIRWHYRIWTRKGGMAGLGALGAYFARNAPQSLPGAPADLLQWDDVIKNRQKQGK